jgi:hypothetical protein
MKVHGPGNIKKGIRGLLQRSALLEWLDLPLRHYFEI